MDMYRLYRHERDNCIHLLDELIIDEYLTEDDKIKKRDQVMAEIDGMLDTMTAISDELANVKKELKDAYEVIKTKN